MFKLWGSPSGVEPHHILQKSMVTQNETMIGTISKTHDIRSRDSDEPCRLCETHN